MWFCTPFRNRYERNPNGQRRPEVERLEDRTLLTVQFTPGPYRTPANRPEMPLGMIGTSFPIEPMLSVNGTQAGNIAVSSQNGVRITTDAGATFDSPASFKDPAGYPGFGGDTDLQFDGEGRLFWSNAAATTVESTVINVSQINPMTGDTIRSTRVSNGPSDDKPFMAIDTNPTSPYFNTIYVVWTGDNADESLGTVYISRSTDQAVSWSTPLALSSRSGEGFMWPSDAAVAPNGDVYVAYHSQLLFSEGVNPDGATGQTFVLRSTDGGLSFTQKSLAFGPGQSDITFNIQTSQRTISGTQFWTQGSAQPWVLADPARPGNVYVVTADDPTDGAGAPYARVVFSRSTDNGASWSFPQPDGMLAPLGGNSFQLFPTAAIDRFGDIVVAWYDNRRGLINSQGHFLLDVFATYSSDGGLTWATAFQVNSAADPFDPDPGAIPRFLGPPVTTRIGEYFGIALFGGTAYVAWNGDSLSGSTSAAPQQVWFSSFALSGALTVTGTAADDTITIQSLPDNHDFVEVLENGQPEYVGLWSALTGITVVATAVNATINIEDTMAEVPIAINLSDGTDQVNLSPTSQNLNTIEGNVTIHGQAGAVLTCNDQSNSGAHTYTITANTIARSDSGLIRYSGVGDVVLNGGSGDDTFIVQSTAPGTSITLNGDSGTNTLVGSHVANIWSILGRNTGTLGGALLPGPVTFLSIQNLIGGEGTDLFRLSDGQGVDGIIDGGGGANTLDYSAYTGNVVVNLQLDSATGVGGGIANIQNVTGGGGPGYNILVGDGGNVLRGGNGPDLLIAGAAASTLLGGTEDNILIGGTTVYDTMMEQLIAILGYWMGAGNYDSRVFDLTHGIAVPPLNPTTVTDNGGGNSLIGGTGWTLFYGNLALDVNDWDPLTETFIRV
jgi:hypothetical protein